MEQWTLAEVKELSKAAGGTTFNHPDRVFEEQVFVGPGGAWLIFSHPGYAAGSRCYHARRIELGGKHIGRSLYERIFPTLELARQRAAEYAETFQPPAKAPLPSGAGGYEN